MIMNSQQKVWSQWALIGIILALICGVLASKMKNPEVQTLTTSTISKPITQNIQKYQISPELVSTWNPYTFKTSYKSEYSTVSFSYDIYYPSDWKKGRTESGNGSPEVTFKKGNECVSLYSRLNGPVRTDVDDITTTLSASPSAITTDYNKQLITTKAIEVNGRNAIKNTYQLSGSNELTFEVLIVGGVSSVNNQFPGTYSDIYTIASCPGTSESTFDKIVSSFILKQPNI